MASKSATATDAEEPAQKNGDLETLGPVDFTTTRFGLPQKYWRYRRSYKKRRKLASQGYVEWYLIDNTHPQPKFVKPEGEGGGIREYEYEGEVYLFPERAMLADEETGIRTVYHKRNEALPINISDPLQPSLKGDELKDYLTKRVTTSPPGFFDNLPFNLDAQTIMAGAIALTILIAVLGGAL